MCGDVDGIVECGEYDVIVIVDVVDDDFVVVNVDVELDWLVKVMV